jgi:hypothetical protein
MNRSRPRSASPLLRRHGGEPPVRRENTLPPLQRGRNRDRTCPSEGVGHPKVAEREDVTREDRSRSPLRWRRGRAYARSPLPRTTETPCPSACPSERVGHPKAAEREDVTCELRRRSPLRWRHGRAYARSPLPRSTETPCPSACPSEGVGQPEAAEREGVTCQEAAGDVDADDLEVRRDRPWQMAAAAPTPSLAAASSPSRNDDTSPWPSLSAIKKALTQWADSRGVLRYLDISGTEETIEPSGTGCVRYCVDVPILRAREAYMPTIPQQGRNHIAQPVILMHGTRASRVARILSCRMLVRGSVDSGIRGMAGVCAAEHISTSDSYARAHVRSATVPYICLGAVHTLNPRGTKCLLLRERWCTMVALRLCWTGGVARTDLTADNILVPEQHELGLCRRSKLHDDVFMDTWNALPDGFFERTCHPQL